MWRVLLLAASGCGRLGFPVQLVADGTLADAAPADTIAPVDVLADAGDGLVARYPMDGDPSAGTIACTNPAYDATCTICPVRVPGHLGSAASFSASASAQIPATALVGAQPFTVAVWAASTDSIPTTGVDMLVTKPFGGSSIFDIVSLSIQSGGFARFESTDATATMPYFLRSTTAVLDGAWHHLAITYDGNTKRIYVDGHLEGSQVIALSDHPQALLVGVDEDSGSAIHYFTGSLDELRIYDRALVDAELADLAAQ